MSKQNKPGLNRRDFLMQSLATTAGIGFRSLLIGVPPAFLTQRAMAAATGKETFLIYSCFSEGCPVNANAPGAYQTGAYHPAPFNTPSTFTLGPTTVQAAAPWAALPQALRDRMNFVHHDTLTNAHAEAENVLKVQGSLKSATGSGQEMLPSAIAQINQQALGTMMAAPIVLGATRCNVTFSAVPQPRVAPSALTGLFPSVISATTKNLQQIRDRAIDSLYRDLRSNGTAAQKAFLNDHALSATQARNLAVQFQSTLSGLGGGEAQDQMVAAAALFAAKVTSSVVIALKFGADNHNQTGTEVTDTNASTAAMTFLWNRLTAMGLADKTTFCLQNVFGRTPRNVTASGGRSHYGAHSVAVLFGPNVKPGVTGELNMALGIHGEATAINSTTGKAAAADVTQDETLAATAKTLMKACGVDETVIDARITKGKILRSAVS